MNERERQTRKSKQTSTGAPGPRGGHARKAEDGATGRRVTPGDRSPSKSRRASLAVAACGLLAAALGAYAWLGGGDQIPSSEANARTAAYESMIAAGGAKLQMVSGDDVPQAVESMPLKAAEKEEMAERVQRGQVRLAWLTVWDTHAEDGDVLSFQVPGSPAIEVTALNAPTTIAVPYPANGEVLVTGVVDGGGGITVALKSGAAEIAWPTMQPGQTLKLPVTPTF